MTTISDVNIVIQQGGRVQQTQNTRHQSLDFNQLAAAQHQEEKDKAKRTSVQEFEESEKIKFDQENPEGRKHQGKKGTREKKKIPAKKDDPEGTGRILNTVA